MLFAFMKLFLDGGLQLDTMTENYRDHVLETGRRGEEALLAVLKERVVNAKGAGSVLRAKRPLHKTSVLNKRISAYKRLLVFGSIKDPAPVDTQDIQSVVDNV
ncbi:hypothetical protein L917_10922 [Phytophthora nicotianae]|uniref:Uncharacterized protein n=1 Tax=Phytophthora nicotianae TaxID=4792 RepID=W2KZ24_PHYNI|nr:hypothetical protein L917_10922 [Phytophthora nicotianae]